MAAMAGSHHFEPPDTAKGRSDAGSAAPLASPSMEADYFTNPATTLSDDTLLAHRGDTFHKHAPSSMGSARRRASLSIEIPPAQTMTNIAFIALQYLPMPVIVLSSSKQVVLANDAIGRLFGIDTYNDAEGETPSAHTSDATTAAEARSTTDILEGRTLSELGFDLLQHGAAMTVAWDDLLDSVVVDAMKSQDASTQLNTHHGRQYDRGTTPTGQKHRQSWSRNSISSDVEVKRNKAEVYDAAVDVVFSTNRDPTTGLPCERAGKNSNIHDHILAKMVISVWATEAEQYFTLMFTAEAAKPASGVTSPHSSAGLAAGGSLSGSTFINPADVTKRTVSKANSASVASLASGPGSNSSSGSNAPGKKPRNSPLPRAQYVNSPQSMSFPPQGPPGKSSTTTAPSMFAKNARLKDAILNSMSTPAYALWRDESFGVPNKAAIKLIYPWLEDGVLDVQESTREFLGRYTIYPEDFVEPLAVDHLPIMKLIHEQKAFDNMRIGMYSAKDGRRMLFDVKGELLHDDKGEFLGGLVIFQDVTSFQNAINVEKERNERQFEDITNMIPQMIWRTDPKGSHDYYSQRWYDYTGLTVEESAGEGWANAFHADDLKVAEPRWNHSLATGDEYLTEYRCKSAAGEWRWMLGRAMPMRDEAGAILKWFGTCTDIHDLVQTREEARQTRAQLAQVIDCARITLWATDKDCRLNLFAGQAMADLANDNRVQRRRLEGVNVFDIMRMQGREREIPLYKAPMDRILTGASVSEECEIQIETNGRWFKTRMFPLLRQDRAGGIEQGSFIDGVVAISLEVTEQKLAAAELKKRDKDNARLMAQSVAAKEASKMKSQFLANMSHEIRTPIAGVIGMSELLLDDDHNSLSKEQKECAENIQRSANGLLTVINDILDFSKVESGRLDIEEVQFDLSVVITDVNKMLSFAAERKGLKFIDDVEHLKSWKVIGDPGRLRQVMTNLLTNSIKFTSEGSVTMSVAVRKETQEMVEVEFVVQDTGIGIEEEVRKKLFTPFSQADSSTARRFGGTGLGLTISKNLVELMHGSISLESKLGVGTRASFWIPFHKAPFPGGDTPLVDIGTIPDRLQGELSVSRPSSQDSTPRSPANADTPRQLNGLFSPDSGSSDGAATLSEAERKAIQILVVEDNAINQQIALKTIKKLGFPVQAVWNGKEAVEYLQHPTSLTPRPDIILMDVQMPIMDGYRATSTIRHLFKDTPEVGATPIVAMTASAIQGDREKCQESGMDDYLAKPVKKPTLEKMLVKWAVEGKRKRAEYALHQHSLNAMRPQAPQTRNSFQSSGDRSQASAEEHLSSELERLEYMRKAAVERSTETFDQYAQRRQQAEEKAILLRDDILLEAGDDPKTKLGKTVTEAELNNGHLSDQGQLTMANIERLSGKPDRLKVDTEVNTEDTSSVLAAVDTTSESVTRHGPSPLARRSG